MTNNKRRRSRYRTTARHEASLGLSAIAELLVMPPQQAMRSGGYYVFTM